MSQRVPQLIVTLTPQGELAVELPGFMATRRKVLLRAKDAGETLLAMLNGQLKDQVEIGLDGAPTQAQVKHWERHQIWADSHCRFCIAEGRAKPDYGAQRQKRTTMVYKTPDGVEVRRIKSGTKGTVVCKKTQADLGL